MAHGDGSEQIRQIAWNEVIEPQVKRGARRIHVAIKPLMKRLEALEFPKNRPRQFCKALQKQSFLEHRGLVLDGIDGPASGTSTTVVLHFSVARPEQSGSTSETAEGRAFRLTEKLRGLLKDEIAAYGGGEAYLRWVRGEGEEAA